MKLLLCMAAAMLALAGCTGTLSPKVTDTLDKACATARTAYSAFTIAAEGELVPAKLDAQVDAGWKGVRIVCENRPANVEQAVLTVTAAVVVFTKALKAIE